MLRTFSGVSRAAWWGSPATGAPLRVANTLRAVAEGEKREKRKAQDAAAAHRIHPGRARLNQHTLTSGKSLGLGLHVRAENHLCIALARRYPWVEHFVLITDDFQDTRAISLQKCLHPVFKIASVINASGKGKGQILGD